MTRFVGTGTLVRLILRRDRRRLPVWWLAQVGLVGVSAVSVQGLYDTPQARATYAATVGTSGASISMSGPPVALDTIGGITVFEVATTAVIGVALMAVFLTLRHTRTDEEAGRTELLRAGVLGRQADLLATGLVVGTRLRGGRRRDRRSRSSPRVCRPPARCCTARPSRRWASPSPASGWSPPR